MKETTNMKGNKMRELFDHINVNGKLYHLIGEDVWTSPTAYFDGVVEFEDEEIKFGDNEYCDVYQDEKGALAYMVNRPDDIGFDNLYFFYRDHGYKNSMWCKNIKRKVWTNYLGKVEK